MQTIHLNSNNFRLYPRVYMVQNDTGRELKMVLDDITLAGTETGAVAIHRSDGSYYTISATLVIADNAFTADMTQALTQPGLTECQLKVTAADDTVVSSYTFMIYVQPSTDGISEEQLGYSVQDIVQAAQDIMAGGMPLDLRLALLQIAQKVAYIDDQGAQYYQDLYDALQPSVTLVSISAVYTQSGTVYDTDTLDSLKSDLVVTANYSDGTSDTVLSSMYSLSGSLTVGTSTITASYDGKTDTFNVTVTSHVEEGVDYGVYTPTDINRRGYIDENGDVQSASNESGYFGDYIPLSSEKKYVLVFTNAPSDSNKINWRLSEYTSGKVFIKQTHFSSTDSDTRTAVMIPTDASTKYIRLGWYNDSTTFVPVFEFVEYFDLPMEIGDIDSSTGADKTSTTRIRSGYISASGTVSESGCPFGKAWEAYGGYAFRCYSSAKGFLGSVTKNGGLFNSACSNVSLPTNTAYIRMFVNKTSGYEFTAGWSDLVVDCMKINGTYYRLTEA